MSRVHRIMRKLGWPILVEDSILVVVDPYYVEYVEIHMGKAKTMGEKNYNRYISQLEQALQDVDRSQVNVVLYEMRRRTGLSKNLIQEGRFDFVRQYYFREGILFGDKNLETEGYLFSPNQKEIYLGGSLVEMCLVYFARRLNSMNPGNKVFLVYDICLSETYPQKTPEELREFYKGAGIDITIVTSDQLDFLKPTKQ